jgi:8-oxo-dGTP diphosphatase
MDGQKDVVCAIILKEGKILATRRGKGQIRQGKWEFPGGKVRQNEAPQDAILREIKEELNITIRLIKRGPSIKYHYPEIKIRLIPFISVWESGSIKMKDHDRFEWFDVSGFTMYNWSEADKQLFFIIKDLFHNSGGDYV